MGYTTCHRKDPGRRPLGCMASRPLSHSRRMSSSWLQAGHPSTITHLLQAPTNYPPLTTDQLYHAPPNKKSPTPKHRLLTTMYPTAMELYGIALGSLDQSLVTYKEVYSPSANYKKIATANWVTTGHRTKKRPTMYRPLTTRMHTYENNSDYTTKQKPQTENYTDTHQS